MSIRTRQVKMSVIVRREGRYVAHENNSGETVDVYYFRPTGCSQAHWRKIQRERFARRYATDMKLARQYVGEAWAPITVSLTPNPPDPLCRIAP